MDWFSLKMLVVFMLLLCSCRSSYCCSCIADGSAIDCSTDDNIAPSTVIDICPKNNLVKSISMGFSVFCYSNLLSFFPNLDSLYVGGGPGSSCDCYEEIVCEVNVAKCVCDHTSTMVTMTTSDLTTTKYVSSTTAHSRSSQNFRGIFVICIVVLFGMLIIFAVVIFIAYKYFYLKMQSQLQVCRERLVENVSETSVPVTTETDNHEFEDEVDALGNDCLNVRQIVGSSSAVAQQSETVGIRPPAVVGGVDRNVTAGTKPPAVDVDQQGTEDIRPPAVAVGGEQSTEGIKPPTVPSAGNREMSSELHESEVTNARFVSVALNGPSVSQNNLTSHTGTGIHFETPTTGIVNDAYGETPKSSLKLVCENEQSHQYGSLASGPMTRQRLLYGATGRIRFKDTTDETLTEYAPLDRKEN